MTCFASTCSQRRVLYLVVHKQSLHCHRSLALHIFSASRSRQNGKNSIKNTFISSDTTVEFALVLFPRILWWAKLVTVWATVACGLDMLGFHVLPKTCLILGRPKTVFALPKITRLDHFVRYCCFNIYERKVNLASFVKFALVVYPRLFRWAEFCTKRTIVSVTLYMNSFNMLPETSLIFGRP